MFSECLCYFPFRIDCCFRSSLNQSNRVISSSEFSATPSSSAVTNIKLLTIDLADSRWSGVIHDSIVLFILLIARIDHVFQSSDLSIIFIRFIIRDMDKLFHKKKRPRFLRVFFHNSMILKLS